MHLVDVLKINIIGKNIEILHSSNKSLINKKGKIIDETKNLLIIQQGKSLKKLIKSQIRIKIPYKGRYYSVDGKLLIGTIEARMKKWRQ